MARIEVFIAGCPLCEPAVATVREIACPNCTVAVYNMTEGEGADAARQYGVTRVPTVVVDGRLADCCGQGTVDANMLRAIGVGS